MLGKSEAEEFRGDAPLAPEFALRDLATHALDFWLTSEDLPEPGQSRHAESRRLDFAFIHAEQSRGPHAAHHKT